MFNSHALPPPSSFAHDHRPLRLTSDLGRPLPAGECHFILLHPSVHNQRCACQSFHLNRNAHGSSCECGHQACYHVHTTAPVQELHHARDPFHAATPTNLVDRVRRLEELLSNERQIMDAAISEERQAREREVRILREALHPFYKSEEDMRRKLLEIEDRIEGNYDEQVRMRDRVVTIDDASMALERRIDDLEGSRKRRRISHQPASDPVTQNGLLASNPGSNHSSLDDRILPHLQMSSRRYTPPSGPPQYDADLDEPRSSGILNLVELPTKSPPYVPSRRPSPPREEARSSGFLALDLAERLSRRMAAAPAASASTQPPRHVVVATTSTPPVNPASLSPGHHGREALSIVSILDSPRMGSRQKRQTSVEVTELSPGDGSPKKRKRKDASRALDVLADISVASPLA